MSRVKTFDSTGLATAGRLYAGDLNAIQDQYADLYNLTQAVGAVSYAVGEAGLQMVRYGAGEARITGALRTDGILRALGGLYAGAFTTTARDAIASGFAPYGLVILNTTTNRYEWNQGTDGARSWQPMGFVPANGVSIANADVSATAAIAYSKLALTGSIANADLAGSIAYSKLILTGAILNADLAGSIAYSKLSLAGAILNSDLAGSIDQSKLAGSIPYSKLVLTGAVTNADLAGSIAQTKLVPMSSADKAGSYTAALVDAFNMISMNGGGNLTIPPNSTVPFPVGTVLNAVQGSGTQVTIVAGAGVTLRSYNSNLKFAGSWAVATFIKRATDEWWVTGNLVP